jgi:rod shape-determining protein MreD
MTRFRHGSHRLETALLTGLGLVAIYIPLVPYSLAAEDGGPPDLLFCLVVAWILRRPDTAPLVLVLTLGLLADVLNSRPMGLGALALVLGSELFRAQRSLLLGAPFVLEWIAVALTLIVAGLCVSLMLKVTFIDGPSIGQLVTQALVTAVFYPVVVVFLHWMIGIRAPEARPQPGRLDPLR